MASRKSVLKSFLMSGAVAAAGLLSLAAPASAQDATSATAVAPARQAPLAMRAVGVKSALRGVAWTEATSQELTRLRLEKAAMTLSRTPAAMSHTKIWVARADVCSEAGEETLVQIRSPLTCGSLGCQMMILTEAGGLPRVMMQTVGDTIDAPSPDEIVINSGAPRERVWRYGAGKYKTPRQ